MKININTWLWQSGALSSVMFIALLFMLLIVPGVGMTEELFNAEEIIVKGNQNISSEEVLYLLDIQPGQPFDSSHVTKGIKRLFKKGIFESISTEIDDDSSGRIVVNIEEKSYVEKVDFSGYRNLSTAFLKRRFPLKKGMFLSEGSIERAVVALEKAIAKRGYPGSKVEVSVVQSDEPYRLSLDVKITEAEPLLVDVINIIGRTVLPVSKIKDLMRFKEGEVFDAYRLERDMQRIERFLRENGYIAPVVGPYTYLDGQLMLGVKPGVRLRIEIYGNTVIGDSSLMRLIAFSEAGEVTDALISETIDRIKEEYAKKSFSGVAIAPVLVGEKDDYILKLYVYEGAPTWVNRIVVKSDTLPPGKFLEIMQVKERKPFKPRELKRDVGRIVELCLALGYRDVEVKEPAVVRKGKRVDILIEVSEGQVVTYSDVIVKVVGALPVQMIANDLTLSAGDPYNEIDITNARRSLRSACRSHGYFFCEVGVKRNYDSRDKVALIFEVNDGNAFFFGKTIIVGNERTRREVFLRHLQYREGGGMDPSLLVQTRQSLYRLGLFKSVELTPLYEDEKEVDIALNVEESEHGSVTFGMGYGEYELFRGFIDISYANLFGMRRRGSFRTEHSTLWSRYILNYQEPYFLGHELLSSTTLLYEKRKEKNVDTDEINYRVEKLSASTGLEKQYSTHVKGSLGYAYSIVRTSDVQPDVVITRDDVGTLAISSVIPGLIYDTRDNAFDPSIGFFSSLKVKYSSESLGSETNFVKSMARVSVYYPVIKRVVFAASVRGGAAKAYDDSEDLPLVERFFLGGRNSVRGYAQDTLGPLGENDNPIGGNSFGQWNLELRIRVAGNWRLVPFMDAGNVWIDPDDAALADLKRTAGLGVQYNTPVGPLRLDYGMKIDPEEGQSLEEIHFSIGHAF